MLLAVPSSKHLHRIPFLPSLRWSFVAGTVVLSSPSLVEAVFLVLFNTQISLFFSQASLNHLPNPLIMRFSTVIAVITASAGFAAACEHAIEL